MAFDFLGLLNNFASSFKVKQPISTDSDGNLVIDLGTDALNAGLKIGASGVQAFANIGDGYAKAGIDSGMDAYGVAGVDTDGNSSTVDYEAAGIAGPSGAAAYARTPTNIYGAGAGEWGSGSFNFGPVDTNGDGTADSNGLISSTGTAAGVQGAASLVSALSNTFGGASTPATAVPDMSLADAFNMFSSSAAA
jgi:hypothetical protein